MSARAIQALPLRRGGSGRGATVATRRLAMLRTMICSLGCLLVCVGVIFADEIKGKFSKFDADKKVLTVSVDGKDKELKVADDVKINGKTPKNFTKVGDRLKDQNLTVTVEKDLVTEIKYEKTKDKTDK
jgi:hypothetical protein